MSETIEEMSPEFKIIMKLVSNNDFFRFWTLLSLDKQDEIIENIKSSLNEIIPVKKERTEKEQNNHNFHGSMGY